MSEAGQGSSDAARLSVRSRRLRRQVVRWGVGLLAAVALVALGYAPLLRGIGAVLVVQDPLERASAIVVLGGHLPFRAIEAADIYRAGWAPRVVLVRGARGEEGEALESLGIALPGEWELNQKILVRLGVPSSAILIPPGEAVDTIEELQIAANAIRPDGAPVIFVTSKVHARRVHLTWHYVAGARWRGIIRPARMDPFDPAGWWRQKRFALAVVREYLGLLNYWAGFPVAARAADAHRQAAGKLGG